VDPHYPRQHGTRPVICRLRASRGQRDVGLRTFLRTLGREWSLIAAGLPAVIILLVGGGGVAFVLGAIPIVLSANVAILFGLGIFGANKAGYRQFKP